MLYSQSLQTYYTGQTADLDRRLEEHNRGKTAFMKKGMPWKLIYKEDFTTRAEAMHLEKQIKKRGASRFLADKGIAVGWRFTSVIFTLKLSARTSV
jgi:putative endonuclease